MAGVEGPPPIAATAVWLKDLYRGDETSDPSVRTETRAAANLRSRATARVDLSGYRWCWSRTFFLGLGVEQREP
jgi:hypothetical protein